ncbi:MAG: dihydroorotase [Helicobacteraceae bacterium]|jgi:dihydroorotase|nr:dihydroorotase [Helicobacteraceae bacterium]
MQEIELVSPFDSHLHLRDGDLLKIVAPISARVFSGAVVMPNLTPPIVTIGMANAYKERILKARGEAQFEPIVALYLTDALKTEEVKNAKIVKLYPIGVTTGSESGITDIDAFDALFGTMQDYGVILSAHGETNGAVLEREAEFAPFYKRLAVKYPRLKIVMEHISSIALVDLLDRYENLYATITLHHLLYTLDDLLGGGLKAHLFCKPIVKTAADRAALRDLAFSAHPKVSFGSDSAPHLRAAKEREGAAGIFSAPVLAPALVELFEERSALGALQAFISDNAQNIYGVKLPRKTVTLIKQPSIVPAEIGGVVPMRAGETIGWSIARINDK